MHSPARKQDGQGRTLWHRVRGLEDLKHSRDSATLATMYRHSLRLAMIFALFLPVTAKGEQNESHEFRLWKVDRFEPGPAIAVPLYQSPRRETLSLAGTRRGHILPISIDPVQTWTHESPHLYKLKVSLRGAFCTPETVCRSTTMWGSGTTSGSSDPYFAAKHTSLKRVQM